MRNMTTYSPDVVRSNALFDGEAEDLDSVPSPRMGRENARDTFEFETLKDPRIDWSAIARCDARDARRRTDIDALEAVLEACVRADIDSISNQEMCEPRGGRELAKLLQLLVEYLLHVQEALSESKARSEREIEGWKERAKRERDDARKFARELRLANETHEAEVIAMAAEYAKRRNNPDSAELEDARRRGESMAAERAARDLEKRLREQRELFDSAVDRMRAAHAEAQAEAARELAARKADLAAARAQYVATSTDSTKEAKRMIDDAQVLIREAREKAELEKSNVSRIRAELNAATEAQQRHKRSLAETKLELTRLQEDFKNESESNAELRMALERRDQERKLMREQIEQLRGKQTPVGEEQAELTSLRALVKHNFTEIERLKRENEVLREDRDAQSKWVADEKKQWVSSNEQISQGELTDKEKTISDLQEDILKLRKDLAEERSKKLITIKPIIEGYEARERRATATTVAPTPEPMTKAAGKVITKTVRAHKAEDMEGSLSAIMNELNVNVDRGVEGLDDAAFQEAMKKFETITMRDVSKDPKMRSRYMEARDRALKQIDQIVA